MKTKRKNQQRDAADYVAVVRQVLSLIPARQRAEVIRTVGRRVTPRKRKRDALAVLFRA
jgi:hypothetical protein